LKISFFQTNNTKFHDFVCFSFKTNLLCPSRLCSEYETVLVVFQSQLIHKLDNSMQNILVTILLANTAC